MCWLRHLTLAAFAVLALAATLAFAATAGAAVIRLNWVEKLDKGTSVHMMFKVATLETIGKRWVATVEIVNRGSGRIAVSGSDFGITEYELKTDFTRPVRRLRATTFRPALPSSIAPGQRWTGMIGGTGRPDGRRYVRLVFGRFTTAASPTSFTWITDHAQHAFTIEI